MAIKRQCDRCGRQEDADKVLDSQWLRGNRWGQVSAISLGDDEYGQKLLADLCGNCWKLLREDFMGSNDIIVRNKER